MNRGWICGPVARAIDGQWDSVISLDSAIEASESPLVQRCGTCDQLWLLDATRPVKPTYFSYCVLVTFQVLFLKSHFSRVENYKSS